MLNSTRPAINSFFIVSASLSEIVDTNISKLSLLARQLYYSRDYNRLAVVGNKLMNLSARSEDVGRYFYSIAEHRLGRKEFDKNLFEDLANHSSQPVRAASHLALGLRALRSDQATEALQRFQESYHLSAIHNSAPLTAIHTANSLSQLLSMNGSHQESLDLLRAIHPAVCTWGRAFPFLLGEQFNNMAYELLRLGELKAAHQMIHKACALPIARAYPEWFETSEEIEDRLRETKSASVVFVPVKIEREGAVNFKRNDLPLIDQEPIPRGNNVYSIRRKRIEIWLKYKTYTHFLQQYSFAGEAAVGSFLVSLLQGIDDLRTGESASTLTIHTRLLECHDVKYETENFISKSNINGLFSHFDDLKLLLEILSSSDAEGEETEADQHVISEQTEKILQLIPAEDNHSSPPK